jgi:hypothetical protein
MLPENCKLDKFQAQGPDYRPQGFPERKNFRTRLAANGIIQRFTFSQNVSKKKGLLEALFIMKSYTVTVKIPEFLKTVKRCQDRDQGNWTYFFFNKIQNLSKNSSHRDTKLTWDWATALTHSCYV